MPNPKTCTKATLVNAVKELKEKCNPNTKVTGTVEQLLITTAQSLKDTASMTIDANLSSESMVQLIAWNLLDIGFLGEEEIPLGLTTTLQHTKENEDVVQASYAKEFDENEVEEIICDETGEALPPVDDEGIGESLPSTEEDIEALKSGIKKLTAKHAKAVEGGKKKKIAKAFAKLDAAKNELMRLKEFNKPEPEPTPEPEPEPEVNPNEERINEIAHEIKALNDNLPTKKKKLKKAQAKILALTDELEALMKDESTPKTKAKKKTNIKRGASARANREIPETISWPKPDSITGTIVSFCQKKPRTIPQILGKLEKSFPDRPISGMTKTVNALVGGVGLPLPLTYTKGIPCDVENDGDKDNKTVFIPVTE